MLTALLIWLFALMLLGGFFGALVGWIAGKIMKRPGGCFSNILLGVIGSVVGGFVANLLGYGHLDAGMRFTVPNLAISVAGACLVIFIARALTSRQK